MHKWFISSDFESVSKAAADFLEDKINENINEAGVSRIALPGGRSPCLTLSFLAEKKLPWNKVYWYLGDERCYPKGHSERNDKMLEEVLWSKLPDTTHVYSMPTELGAEKAAEAYREVISKFDSFDIIFLGMGEDGHTASLFPDNPALQDERSVVPVFNSPKPPSDRVSLSVDTIKRARYRMIVTAGGTKAPIIKNVKQGASLPVNQVGEIYWFVDEKAVAKSAE